MPIVLTMFIALGGVPVVDGDGSAGMISDGDLLHRAEADAGHHRSRWLSPLSAAAGLARDYDN